MIAGECGACLLDIVCHEPAGHGGPHHGTSVTVEATWAAEPLPRSGHSRYFRQVEMEWRGLEHGQPVYGPKWVVEEVVCRTLSAHDTYEEAVDAVRALPPHPEDLP